MHRDMDETPIYGEHLIVCFNTFFEFQIFVPERMSQEVKTNAACATLEEPVGVAVSMKCALRRGLGEERVEEGKHGICVCVR